MTTLETTMSRIAKLPPAERDELVSWLDAMLDGIESGPAATLSAEQLAELERRLAGPEDLASDEEVEAFFARHRTSS